MAYQALLLAGKLLSKIPYGTFANYSPRGTTVLSQKSKIICGRIKNGDEGVIKNALKYLRDSMPPQLHPFLNSDVTLVPIPRSAPTADGSLWPSKVIADLLLREGGFAKELIPCITRIKAVPKSSTSPPNQRPSVVTHYESLEVADQLIKPDQITLVDDVLTQGRVAFACAWRLHEVFPDAQIRVFAMIRTQGLISDIDKIMDPDAGTITFNQHSGKTDRYP